MFFFGHIDAHRDLFFRLRGPAKVERLNPRNLEVQNGTLVFKSYLQLRRASSDTELRVCVPRNCEVLNFSEAKCLSLIVFESNSLVHTFDAKCFAETTMRSIWIPRTVSRIGNECFKSMEHLHLVTFEAN
jgi:hypothetical protein